MRFLRQVAGYTLQNRNVNVDVRQAVNIMITLDRIAKYRLKWMEQLNRMDDRRIPCSHMELYAEKMERSGTSEEALE